MPKENGIIIYQGPSLIDGAPIVCIATGLSRKSANSKTDAMVQTWILRADVTPLEALRTGADVSLCGPCVHRPKRHDGAKYYERTCYVNVAQAPTSVHKAFLRGSYRVAEYGELPALFAGKMLRLGSYGDPAAVPVGIWRAATLAVAGWTGYTHQWRNRKLQEILQFCQVSADSSADVDLARSRGIAAGSFRVRPLDPAHPDHTLRADEIVCPASAEAGYKASCATCGMCSGATGQTVAILAHGIGAKQYSGRTRRAVAA
jgi:hypothetical protein